MASNTNKHKMLLGLQFPIFQVLRNENKFCDLTIKVNDVKILAHRIFLAATIPYFYNVFKEMGQNQISEITIEEVEASAVENILNYVYTGKLQIDFENVESILRSALFFQLANLQKDCGKFLISNLKLHNALRLRHFAFDINYTYLLKPVQKFVDENFCIIVECNEFFELELQKLLDLFKCDTLKVPSEEYMFEVAFKWIKYKIPERASLIPEVLSGIRLSLLSSEFLNDRVNREDLIRNSQPCQNLMAEVKPIDMSPEYPEKPPAGIPLRCYGKLLLAGCGDNAYKVEAYDLLLKKWIVLCTTEYSGKTCSIYKVISLKGKFFRFSTDSRTHQVGLDFHSLNYPGNLALKSPQLRRTRYSVGYLNSCLYICSGIYGNTICSFVECFNTETEDWTLVASMPVTILEPSITAFIGNLYACGGTVNNSTKTALVFRYAPNTNKWFNVKAMEHRRSHIGVATMNDKLYAVGGFTDNNVRCNYVEVYDPNINEWETVAPMTCNRANMVLSPFMNELWVMGGEDINVKQTIEIYNPITKTWRFGPPSGAMKYYLAGDFIYGHNNGLY